MADRKTVEVGCRIPNGLVLRGEGGEVVLNGSRRHTGGPGLPLDVAYTEVDAKAFGAWWEANEGGDLVASGAVFKKGDEPDEVKAVQKAEAKVEKAREAETEAKQDVAEAQAKADADIVKATAPQGDAAPSSAKPARR